jgi:hypothetical protein
VVIASDTNEWPACCVHHILESANYVCVTSPAIGQRCRSPVESESATTVSVWLTEDNIDCRTTRRLSGHLDLDHPCTVRRSRREAKLAESVFFHVASLSLPAAPVFCYKLPVSVFASDYSVAREILIHHVGIGLY